jgi:hypothetical protein
LLFAAVVVVEAVTEVPVARMQNLHNSDNVRLYVQRYYITAAFTNIFGVWGRPRGMDGASERYRAAGRGCFALTLAGSGRAVLARLNKTLRTRVGFAR